MKCLGKRGEKIATRGTPTIDGDSHEWIRSQFVFVIYLSSVSARFLFSWPSLEFRCQVSGRILLFCVVVFARVCCH